MNSHKIIIAGIFFCTLSISSCDSTKRIKSHLIQDCPSKKITDKMPTIGTVKGERAYYIYKGSRHEIKEFDADWLQKNCHIEEETVY